MPARGRDPAAGGARASLGSCEGEAASLIQVRHLRWHGLVLRAGERQVAVGQGDNRRLVGVVIRLQQPRCRAQRHDAQHREGGQAERQLHPVRAFPRPDTGSCAIRISGPASVCLRVSIDSVSGEDRQEPGASRPAVGVAVHLRVSPPDDEERDRDQGGGECHEDAGLDELERPEPVARLAGHERAVTEPGQARECGVLLALSRRA